MQTVDVMLPLVFVPLTACFVALQTCKTTQRIDIDVSSIVDVAMTTCFVTMTICFAASQILNVSGTNTFRRNRSRGSKLRFVGKRDKTGDTASRMSWLALPEGTLSYAGSLIAQLAGMWEQQ